MTDTSVPDIDIATITQLLLTALALEHGATPDATPRIVANALEQLSADTIGLGSARALVRSVMDASHGPIGRLIIAREIP